MTSLTSSGRKQGLLLIAGILMIATTLRVTFTGAAPLLDAIRADYGLTTAQTGLLTTLPLLAFALISPLAAGAARRFGMERSLATALILICAGIALRSLPSATLLFIGTAIVGCGIALGNVLLPGLIKRDFPGQVAKLTGAYSLTMGAAAALGSALVVPLALHGFGWRGALLMLMAFPLVALLLWLPQTGRRAASSLTQAGSLQNRGIWRSALAWQVTLFLGINSLIYYVVIGWLPAILLSLGYSETQAGSLHGLLQLATAAPGIVIPLILHRLRDQRSIAALVALMCAVSAAGLWLVPAHARSDLYRPACQLGASGGSALRHGAVSGLPAGGIWPAADGQDPRRQRRLAHSADRLRPARGGDGSVWRFCRTRSRDRRPVREV